MDRVRWFHYIFVLVILSAGLQAQVNQAGRQTYGDVSPVAPAAASAAPNDYSSSNETKMEPSALGRSPDVKRLHAGFDWEAAANQSFFFLAVEHGIRMSQSKTRREFGGPFFEDYRNAVSGLGGWGDTDSVFTNYVAHPMQGAVTGYIQIQNDPTGSKQEFGRDPRYWKSRARAMAWSALYSTQFELGPISEASLGNVGKKRGTMGFVDLVMTPVGGAALILTEDFIDKRFIEGMEARTDGLNRRRLYRMFLNPQRTFANLLRLKKPWHRDTRSISWDTRDVAPKQPTATQKTQPVSGSN